MGESGYDAVNFIYCVTNILHPQNVTSSNPFRFFSIPCSLPFKFLLSQWFVVAHPSFVCPSFVHSFILSAVSFIRSISLNFFMKRNTESVSEYSETDFVFRFAYITIFLSNGFSISQANRKIKSLKANLMETTTYREDKWLLTTTFLQPSITTNQEPRVSETINNIP